MSGISRERALLVAAVTVSFSVVTLMRKFALRSLTPLQFEIISGITHVCMVPFFIIAASKMCEPISTWDTKDVIISIAAIIINVVTSIAFMYVLRGGNDVGMMSSLVSASPVITLMLSTLFLGEQPTFRSATGVALVLIGVTITAWK